MIKTRSVQSEKHKDDGLRILATRFRGRGLPASKYDVWMPALGPSEQLLKAVMGGAIEWKEFTRRYHDELFMDGPIDDPAKNHQESRTKIDAPAVTRAQRAAERDFHCHSLRTWECRGFCSRKEIAKPRSGGRGFQTAGPRRRSTRRMR
jgi:uncharacterized protein YeaO (DUF488 family)